MTVPKSNSILTYDAMVNLLCSHHLPAEIWYKYCSFCEIKLCDYHATYAKCYLTYYKGYDYGYMCNKCCLKID